MNRSIPVLLAIVFVLCACSRPQAERAPEVLENSDATSERLPTREVVVESGYYLERHAEGTVLVAVQDFVPHDAVIIDYPRTEGFELDFEQDVTAIYCGEECFQIYFTEGDSHRVREVQENIKLYVEFADGTFAELSVNPPPSPECLILGVFFSDVSTLVIKFSDFDGVQKMSMWSISDVGAQEIDTLPFVDDSWLFSGHAFAGEVNASFAAMIGNEHVSVFSPDNGLIDRVSPCMRG